MKTAIVYYSKHHENTKKVLDALKNLYDVTLIDITAFKNIDLTQFDIVGFASGIYYQTFNKSILEAASNVPVGKNVFFIYTCGVMRKNYIKDIEKAVSGRNVKVLGSYGCKGYDTFGPFKLIGGIAKKRPNNEDIAGAIDFYGKILSEAGEK